MRTDPKAGIYMKIVDLHVHSNKSDGTLSPSELVDLAVQKGLSAFALTDHDTTAGLDEAIEYAKGRNIEVIPESNFPPNMRTETSMCSALPSSIIPRVCTADPGIRGLPDPAQPENVLPALRGRNRHHLRKADGRISGRCGNASALRQDICWKTVM